MTTGGGVVRAAGLAIHAVTLKQPVVDGKTAARPAPCGAVTTTTIGPVVVVETRAAGLATRRVTRRRLVEVGRNAVTAARLPEAGTTTTVAVAAAVATTTTEEDGSAIREAMKSWRFKPRTLGGQAVGAWGTFKVRFKLD